MNDYSGGLSPEALERLRATAAQSHDVVDVHAHYQPPAFRAMGMPGPMNAWNLQRHIDEMGAAGVAPGRF